MKKLFVLMTLAHSHRKLVAQKTSSNSSYYVTETYHVKSNLSFLFPTTDSLFSLCFTSMNENNRCNAWLEKEEFMQRRHSFFVLSKHTKAGYRF